MQMKYYLLAIYSTWRAICAPLALRTCHNIRHSFKGLNAYKMPSLIISLKTEVQTPPAALQYQNSTEHNKTFILNRFQSIRRWNMRKRYHKKYMQDIHNMGAVFEYGSRRIRCYYTYTAWVRSIYMFCGVYITLTCLIMWVEA